MLIKNYLVFYGNDGINEYNVNGIKTIHAEINAINKIKKSNNNRKVIMVVYRTNKTGSNLLCSRPCLHCLKQSFIQLYKKNYCIYRFYFFNESNKLEYYTKSNIQDIIY